MLFPILERGIFLFSFKVYCLRVSGVSGRESLDRDVLLKAIISLYSTICVSRLLSGLFAFKASSQVTEPIRGSAASECKCYQPGSDWAGPLIIRQTQWFLSFVLSSVSPWISSTKKKKKNHRLAFSDSSYPLSLVVTVCVIKKKKKKIMK